MADLALNVDAYGALGDNTADDTAAIQAALDAVAGDGGFVFLPPGVYIVSRLQPKSGTRIFGPGVLKQKAATATGNMAAIEVAPGRSDITIDGIEIDGNKANQTNERDIAGIRVLGTSVTITGCNIYDTERDGIKLLPGAGQVAIEGNRIVGIGTSSVPAGTGWGFGVNAVPDAVTPIASVLVSGNYISDTGLHNVGIVANSVGGRYWRVVGNHLRNAGEDAFAAYAAGNYAITYTGNVVETPQRGNHLGGRRLVIVGNAVYDPGSNGVLLGSYPNEDPPTSSQAVISANQVLSPGGAGIELRNFDRTSIDGNEIEGAGGHGIAILGTYGATAVLPRELSINGNTVVAAGADGIHLRDVNVSAVNGNVARLCAGWGIRSIDSANRICVTGNTAHGNTTGQISLVGAKNVNANNLTA